MASCARLTIEESQLHETKQIFGHDLGTSIRIDSQPGTATSRSALRSGSTQVRTLPAPALEWDFGPWSTDSKAGKIAGVACAQQSSDRARRCT